MKKLRIFTSLTAIILGIVLAVKLPDIVAELSYASYRGRSLAAREALSLADNLPLAFEHVSDAIKPSVVSVDATQYVRSAASDEKTVVDPDVLRRFFGLPDPHGNRSVGMGSGLIVDANGLIVTNYHVIEGANQVTVRLSNGRSYPAEIVGTDPPTDLALLRIAANDLVAAEWGDSEQLRVGQWVLAAGSPLGLDQTVTAGIVSATGRFDIGIAEYEDFIQTDAAINPGNSGGPLLNMQGAVVGINTAIASRTGGYMGIGFAIPSSMVQKVIDNLIREGEVHRGRLGTMIQDLDEDLARSFGLDGQRGVVISDVLPGSPAAKANLMPGDVITRFNGRTIQNTSQLRNEVATTPPGTEVELEFFRDGKSQTVTVEVDLLSPSYTSAAPSEANRSDLGLSVEPLTPLLRERLKIDEETDGLLVSEVREHSPAAKAGIRLGDLITSIDDQPVVDEESFDRALAQSSLSEGIRLQVSRGGLRRYVVMREP